MSDNRISQSDPGFRGGLPEGTEVVLLKAGQEVIKTDVTWFDACLDAEGCSELRPELDVKVLGSSGWTTVEELARRTFWEHESTVTVAVRKGKASFACGTVVPIIRGGRQTASEVEHLSAGDTVIMHDYMMLRKGHTDPAKQVIVRHQGVMDRKKNPSGGQKLYFIRTSSGDIIADGIVAYTGR